VTTASRRKAGPVARPQKGDPLVWLLLGVTLAVWLFETGGLLWRTSHWDHYVYLADAFLNGQLHLFHHPADAGDMAIVGGRAFIVFGPLPALLLMPLVPFFGPATPDVLVLVLTALFAIFAFDRFLTALPDPPDRFKRSLATLTFGLGTAIHYGAPMGNVWLHAQISATALQCWALWMAARGRGWWSGVALGLSVLTRPTVTLAAPLAAWLLANHRADDDAPATHPLRQWSRAGLALGVPMLAAAALHARYNLARFGSPSDAGYHYILMGDAFKGLIARYGRFNLHFLPHNLGGWLLALPHLEDGALVPDGHGMSLLLTTPFLLLLFAPRRLKALEWVMLGTALLIALPSLLYYNDGWTQFGQRFSLDWIALALAACALAARRVPGWIVATVAVVGIAVNTWGMLWFQANNLH
jgi:hypothetical protein